MENEFVSYIQAVDLKELGFNEKGFMSYDKEGHLRYFMDAERFYKYSEDPLAITPIWAPTYSQAFRWMREKHLTYGIISPTNVSKIQGIDCILEIHPPPDKHGIVYILEDGKLYTSYEEAELACLDKLIELVKVNENI